MITQYMTIHAQLTGLKRDVLDKYYTAPHAVTHCMEKIHEYLVIYEDDLCIEPSAGNGSFMSDIKTLGCASMFYDLEPEHPEIVKQDYLEIDTSSWKQMYNRIHVIGNPPFGRQSSMAVRFIKKSVAYADSVSFILPRSFKKCSMQRYFPDNFHL